MKSFQPFIFDVLGPEGSSLLPMDFRLVVRAPMQSVQFSRSKQISRIVTRGGVVEQHWGDALTTVTFSMVTSGFVRLYSGLSSTTGGYGALDLGGTRRETLGYDDYLDIRSLYHSNGSVYDTQGNIVFQGVVQMTYAEGVYQGFFSTFTITEDKAFQFTLSATFNVTREVLTLRSGSL